MKSRNHLSSLVIVDYLAFTVPLSSFMYLERAGKDATNRNKWAKLPKKSFKRIKCPDLKQQKVDDYQAEMRDVLYRRCHQFLSQIMNLHLSSARDKGLYGYTDSCKILDSTRRVELGHIGFGGNNDTIHIQISGEGCKHVFDSVSPFVLHFWLSKVLFVTRLSRVDLAFDDFDGNFDTSYAERAYNDDAFKNPRGGKTPVIDIRRPMTGTKIMGDTVYVGTRKSPVFWRIYDKALQQGIHDKTWYRNEVELKKVTVDVLQNPALSFAGLNRFSSSLNIEHGTTTYTNKKRAALDLASKLRWVKQQCGRTLADVAELFGGDINAAYGAIVDNRGGKFSIPDTQANILNTLYQYSLSDTEPLSG